MQYVIETYSKRNILISEEEYKKIAAKINHGNPFMFALKNGDIMNSTNIASITNYADWSMQYKQRLRDSGRRLCKYGSIHWLNEECTCRPAPGEATSQEIEESKKLIRQANAVGTMLPDASSAKLLPGTSGENPTGQIFYIDENGDKQYS